MLFDSDPWTCTGKKNHELEDCGLSLSCLRGHIDVAKYLYKTFEYSDKIIAEIFHELCCVGNLNILKWLYEQKQFQNVIKIKEYRNKICDYACPKIMKEIFSDFVIDCFVTSCIYKQLPVMKWLNSIYHIDNEVFRILYYDYDPDCMVDIDWHYRDTFSDEVSHTKFSNDNDIKYWLECKFSHLKFKLNHLRLTSSFSDVRIKCC